MNLKKIIWVLGCVSVLYACTPNSAEKKIEKKTYFDLTSFFNHEVQQLQSQNPWVEKTVQADEVSQSKKLKISDWKQELSVFSEADINKSSWIGYFKIDSTAQNITYTSTKAQIPVKTLEIERDNNNQVVHIHIIMNEANILYHSADTLDYYPNQGYQIHKWQKTKMLNESMYKIKARVLNL